MLAYRAILSRIYRLKPFFSNCKMSLCSKYLFCVLYYGYVSVSLSFSAATFKKTFNLHKN